MNKFTAFPMVFLVNDNLFSHYHEFEKFLADVANSKNMQLENLSTEGSPFKVIGISKKPELEIPKAPQGRPVDSKTILNNMRNTQPTAKVQNFNQGKFLPTKGYLKKE